MMAKQLSKRRMIQVTLLRAARESFKRRVGSQRTANYTKPQWTAVCRPSEMKNRPPDERRPINLTRGNSVCL